ncbi:MAG: hypothetical protein Q9175_002859 [Cornicularia normoerica]
MSIIRMVIYYKALTVQFDPDADFEYITSLTSYFSLLEAGLGLCAACLPVQYALLRSEKVRSIFQSVYSLATLGSRGSVNSRGSRGSHISRRSGARSYRLRDPAPGIDNKKGSQSSEIDVPLPTHAAAAAGHEPSRSEVETRKMQEV